MGQYHTMLFYTAEGPTEQRDKPKIRGNIYQVNIWQRLLSTVYKKNNLLNSKQQQQNQGQIPCFKGSSRAGRMPQWTQVLALPACQFDFDSLIPL